MYRRQSPIILDNRSKIYTFNFPSLVFLCIKLYFHTSLMCYVIELTIGSVQPEPFRLKGMSPYLFSLMLTLAQVMSIRTQSAIKDIFLDTLP